MMFGAVECKCCRCGTDFYLPPNLHSAARASEKISFYCPYGHEQHYPAGETETDKIRRERDLLAQRIAQRDDTIKFLRETGETAKRSLAAQKGVVTKIKKRVGSGVCPCCTRSFGNLRRHMQTEHPEFKAEEVAA
jgi:hypothetical protein